MKTKGKKRTLTAFIAIILAIVCMACASVSASAASGGGRHDGVNPGSYLKTYYVVPKSGLVYAKDRFNFTVSSSGKVTVHSISQYSVGWPKKGWTIIENGGNYAKVATFWGSNPSIRISIKQYTISFPTFKSVTCYYTIYNDGRVILDRKA